MAKPVCMSQTTRVISSVSPPVTLNSKLSKCKLPPLSLPNCSDEALHVTHVDAHCKHARSQRSANLGIRLKESELDLSDAKILSFCLDPFCQKDPDISLSNTKNTAPQTPTKREASITGLSQTQPIPDTPKGQQPNTRLFEKTHLPAHILSVPNKAPFPLIQPIQKESKHMNGVGHDYSHIPTATRIATALSHNRSEETNLLIKQQGPFSTHSPVYKTPTDASLPTTPTSILGPYPQSPNRGELTSKMENYDEIATLFSSIVPTTTNSSRRIPLPQHITAARDWSLSCLARVITDRTVFDDNFTRMMMRDWQADPRTRISPIAKNTYLVDFATMKEMYEVLEKEPWFYSTDVVSMRKVHEPTQLRPDFVDHVSLWTQFHNVPPEMLSAEGIVYLAEKIGTPISEVRQAYHGGRLFMRVQIAFSTLKGLEDTLPLDHPTLGPITIHLVYERAARLCSFCGFVEHVISGCAKHNRVLQLSADPAYADRPELPLLREHRKGAWINCIALVPREIPAEPEPEWASPPTSPPAAATNQQQNPPLPMTDPLTQTNLPQQGVDHDDAYHPDSAAGPTMPGQRHRHFTSDRRPSFSDQASPLSCPATEHAETSNLSNQTRQLTIHDYGGRRNSDSPPPGYHKRLRAASPESPPGQP